jgi:hypothetical protein
MERTWMKRKRIRGAKTKPHREDEALHFMRLAGPSEARQLAPPQVAQVLAQS